MHDLKKIRVTNLETKEVEFEGSLTGLHETFLTGEVTYEQFRTADITTVVEFLYDWAEEQGYSIAIMRQGTTEFGPEHTTLEDFIRNQAVK